MRIWYVQKGGASASRIASCDLSAADDTRRFNTLAPDECAQLSTGAREVAGLRRTSISSEREREVGPCASGMRRRSSHT